MARSRWSGCPVPGSRPSLRDSLSGAAAGRSTSTSASSSGWVRPPMRSSDATARRRSAAPSASSSSVCSMRRPSTSAPWSSRPAAAWCSTSATDGHCSAAPWCGCEPRSTSSSHRLRDTQESRPLLAGDARAALERLESERTALYEEVADIVVDVDGVEIEDRGRAGRSDARRAAMMVSVPDRIAAADGATDATRTAPPRGRRRDHCRGPAARRAQLPGPGGSGRAPRSGGAPPHRVPAGRRRHPGVDPGRGRSRPRAPRAGDPRRRGAQDPRHGRGPLLGLRPSRTHSFGLRRRARRGRGHRRRRVRRCQLPPGDRRGARADDAARPDRCCDRRQDRREPARGQEPGRRLLAARGGALRPRGPRVAARA